MLTMGPFHGHGLWVLGGIVNHRQDRTISFLCGNWDDHVHCYALKWHEHDRQWYEWDLVCLLAAIFWISGSDGICLQCFPRFLASVICLSGGQFFLLRCPARGA